MIVSFTIIFHASKEVCNIPWIAKKQSKQAHHWHQLQDQNENHFYWDLDFTAKIILAESLELFLGVVDAKDVEKVGLDC